MRRIDNPARLHPPIEVRSRRGPCWELDHLYEETCQRGSELLQENAAQGPYEGLLDDRELALMRRVMEEGSCNTKCSCIPT